MGGGIELEGRNTRGREASLDKEAAAFGGRMGREGTEGGIELKGEDKKGGFTGFPMTLFQEHRHMLLLRCSSDLRQIPALF
ncbi:hypothetical protein SAY87_027715 [Trapa incisa]|uniref:Uncharacterized protein n=1 Tax=Trapa incisa TaxID=236973 RepID=A0AAN7JMU7_9MYRT|nr:hypothetical protein SAY87_027715 [Trapa incisa]